MLKQTWFGIRGVVIFLLAFGELTQTEAEAQGFNYYVLTNGYDAMYQGVGAGGWAPA